MRLFTRALIAALLPLTLGACSIGEGNGIVSIEIVEFDGSTDFEMRADQCEGTLLGLLATFTDGQQTVYTHRAEWSSVGNAQLNELKNSLELTTAVEALPASATAGDIIAVTATYLSLTATKNITVNNIAIESIQLEPTVLALISGETQNINTVLTLNDGSTSLNPVRGLHFNVADDTAFTANGFNSNGQALLTTTETASTTGPTEANISLSCDRENGTDPIATATAYATHYDPSSNDISLEISSNFDGNGNAVANGSARQLPTNTLVGANATLKFANNNVTRLVTGLADWTASNPTDCSTDGANCSATTSTGLITTHEAITGETRITANYSIDETHVISADQPLIINVSDLQYGTPAFKLNDESGNPIDSTIDPAISLASNTGRILQFIAQLVDSSSNPYELAVTPSFTVAETDEDKLSALATTLAGLASTEADVTVSVNTDTLMGAQSAPAAFTNNIPTFVAQVHIDAPTGLFVDSNSDGVADTSATLANGESIQLRSFLRFTDKDSILRTGATAWSTSDNTSAVVGNSVNSGVVTVLDNSNPVTITATHIYTDHLGVNSTQTTRFIIN